MQIDDDEEHARAVHMRVADEPAGVHVAHDMLDRIERDARVRGIVHRQNDAGDDLDHQRGAGEDAEVPEIIEVARHRIAGARGIVDEARNRQLLVHPLHQRMRRLIGFGPGKAHLISLLSRSSRRCRC